MARLDCYNYCRPAADYEDTMTFFFNDDKDEFYVSSAPSENIWKKFELLLTPPRSPLRDDCCKADVNDDEWSLAVDKDSLASAANLKCNLIQDCMWSGNEDTSCNRTERDRKDSLSDMPMPPPATDCVDPTAVFPYPLNREHSYSMMTPAPSDSEDEIDVVTVENTKIRITTIRKPAPIGCHPQQAVSSSDLKNLSAVAEKLKFCQQKRPARCLGATEPVCSVVPPPSKKPKKSSLLPAALSPSSSGSGSHAGSDSEDYDGKRSMHNVLERKRRNDLKSSFFVLRDHVPELRHQERAAKVVILSKATEYATRLRQEERGLLEELAAEAQRRARLLDQLERLRAHS